MAKTPQEAVRLLEPQIRRFAEKAYCIFATMRWTYEDLHNKGLPTINRFEEIARQNLDAAGTWADRDGITACSSSGRIMALLFRDAQGNWSASLHLVAVAAHEGGVI